IDIHPGAPAQQQSQKQIEAPRILVETLTIRNTSLTYSDGSTTVKIPSFQIEVRNGRGTVHLDSPVAISPDLQVGMSDLPLQLSDRNIDFGPFDWQLNHPDIRVTGSSAGRVVWSPSLELNVHYSTSAFSYRNWRDIESSGNIGYADDVLKIS